LEKVKQCNTGSVPQLTHVLQYENRIEYIPVKPTQKMRGFSKGMGTSVKREKDRI
jgi:hypothetical protein